MTTKSPYEIIKHRHMTEKSEMLSNLAHSNSNPSIKRFECKKYVFVVDSAANKAEIKQAVEHIYSDKQIKVVSVNTVNAKSKPKRRGRTSGRVAGFKKAIVTLSKGDHIETN